MGVSGEGGGAGHSGGQKRGPVTQPRAHATCRDMSVGTQLNGSPHMAWPQAAADLRRDEVASTSTFLARGPSCRLMNHWGGPGGQWGRHTAQYGCSLVTGRGQPGLERAPPSPATLHVGSDAVRWRHPKNRTPGRPRLQGTWGISRPRGDTAPLTGRCRECR